MIRFEDYKLVNENYENFVDKKLKEENLYNCLTSSYKHKINLIVKLILTNEIHDNDYCYYLCDMRYCNVCVNDRSDFCKIEKIDNKYYNETNWFVAYCLLISQQDEKMIKYIIKILGEKRVKIYFQFLKSKAIEYYDKYYKGKSIEKIRKKYKEIEYECVKKFKEEFEKDNFLENIFDETVIFTTKDIENDSWEKYKDEKGLNKILEGGFKSCLEF